MSAIRGSQHGKAPPYSRVPCSIPGMESRFYSCWAYEVPKNTGTQYTRYSTTTKIRSEFSSSCPVESKDAQLSVSINLRVNMPPLLSGVAVLASLGPSQLFQAMRMARALRAESRCRCGQRTESCQKLHRPVNETTTLRMVLQLNQSRDVALPPEPYSPALVMLPYSWERRLLLGLSLSVHAVARGNQLQHGAHTEARGVLSSQRRFDHVHSLQTGAALNPRVSGASLLNDWGLVASMLADRVPWDSDIPVPGLHFFVASKEVERVLLCSS